MYEKYTAQKMKFFIKDFFSKCDQKRRKQWIWSQLLKKFLMENFIFWAVILKVIIIFSIVFTVSFITLVELTH